MIKNVFIKSILRQPVRSLLLFTLIGIAAFAFVLRTVEYIAIHRHIHQVGRNYRAIGFVRGQTDNEDITQAANLLAQSPFMGYEDRRRRFEGLLQDTYSPDVAGMPHDLPPEERRVYSAAYFYADLSSVNRDWEDYGYIQLNVRVREVIAASPNHVNQGQQLVLWYDFLPGDDTSLVDNLILGERHFFKGHFYRLNFGSPVVGRTQDHLFLQPIPEAHIMQAEIERIQRETRTVMLQTTTDMTMLPDLQGRRTPMSIQRGGRLIDRNDYLAANPVAVIHQNFAWMRDIRVGDTITVRVYQSQFIERTFPSTWETSDGVIAARTELIVAATPGATEYIDIELEVVGMYNSFFRTDRTFGYGIIYIPDSVIPPGFYVATPEYLPEDYLPDTWYGFVLNSTRDEQAFFVEYRDIMAAYGLTLHMFRSGADVFWTAADSILLMTAFNALVFGFVVVLILSLVSFLYAKQRQREFAIARSLGVSVKKIILQICISVFIIGLPAAIIGSGVAWHFALEEAANVLEPFQENLSPDVPHPFRFDFVSAAIEEAAQLDFSPVWLALLTGVVFIFILALILLNVYIHLRRPVLQQLQGRAATNTWGKSANVLDEEVPDYTTNASSIGLPKFDARPKPGASFAHALGWIFAHIRRSPVKTALAIAIALFFVIALGWLQESILRAEDNIDYLYDNTVVHVELETHGMQFTAFERLMMIEDRGYFETIAAEATYHMTFVIPKDAHGNPPEDWQEIIGFMPDVHTNNNIWAGVFDFIIGTSCLDAFITQHSTILMGDATMGLAVDLVEGFDTAAFAYDDPTLATIIPIVISQSTAYERGISLGETVYFAYNRLPAALSPWHFAQAKVVGIHNHHIHISGFEHGMIVSTSVVEYILGAMTIYFDLRLTVDTAFNRQLDSARYVLDYYLVQHRGWTPWDAPLQLLFFDEELRNMVGAMSQILLLLELLYPIALALAIIIGAAVALLLMLQMEQNAAIARVLGASKFKTCVMLCTEQIIVCTWGLIIGLAALTIISWGFGLVALVTVAGIYMASVIVGAVVGAVIITARAPIDLLQVRE